MKYPQLVSTRAVSAISDWLVTQLDQLGVDASSVYSRLLLSLLHTPLQINALDLAEISDNKVHKLFSNLLQQQQQQIIRIQKKNTHTNSVERKFSGYRYQYQILFSIFAHFQRVFFILCIFKTVFLSIAHIQFEIC